MRKPMFVKRPAWQYPWMVLQGFANILDGTIMVISLGFFVSSFALEVCKMRTERHFKTLKKQPIKN